MAIDPFADMSAMAASRGMQFDYPLIEGVEADLLLVTHEHIDHNGVEAIGGDPRSCARQRAGWSRRSARSSRSPPSTTKSQALLMDRSGRWELAPAFDLTYAYRPASVWTGRHQMTMNAKLEHFTLADFRACGRAASLPRGRATRILEEVRAVVSEWETYAERVQVDEEHVRRIAPALRLSFPSG